MTWTCPNCSASLSDAPRACPRCEYRPENAREYFWLYASGMAFIALGFALGAMSLIVADGARDHWSRRFDGWFPLAPFSGEDLWIAFLLAGILYTLAGLGLTRHFWSSWYLLLGLATWQAVVSSRELLIGEPEALGTRADTWTKSIVLIAALGVLALAARVGIALKRTPPRDIRRLQTVIGDRERDPS
jgi:hypothetical protein